VEEPIEVTLEISAIFRELGVEYVVGGSLASSLHGHPRSTQDIDVVADLRPEHVTPFTAALERA
jgi:tRNA nucleotidyltransferase/poly(A) polymerase